MTRPRGLVLLVLTALVVGAWCWRPARVPSGSVADARRPAGLDPACQGVVIPPNLAPVNVRVTEPGTRFVLRVSGAHGRPLTVASRQALLRLPARGWRSLLAANRGGQLRYEVWARDGGAWQRFSPTTLRVAADPIDRYLVYRLLRPLDNTWSTVGIYERDLTSYRQRCLIHGRQYDNGCVNCHSFRANHTDRMALSIRSEAYGASTILSLDGRIQKLQPKSGYPTWHPSGQLLVFTMNKVHQWFHPAAEEAREVLDLTSGLAWYRIGSDRFETIPELSNPDDLVTWPAWSADGRYLYYCRTRMPWTDRHRVPPKHHDQLKYDLWRIPYAAETVTWGSPEVLLTAQAAGGCLQQPRPTPDGRRLIFVICDYGAFPIHRREADLCELDLATRQWRRLRINSDRTESWHSLSSNGRWMVFSSKRRDGCFVRPYLTYLDPVTGEQPPLLLPQRDPAFYDTILETYNLPELAVEPAPVSPRALGPVVRDPVGLALELPEVYREKKAAPPEAGAWKAR